MSAEVDDVALLRACVDPSSGACARFVAAHLDRVWRYAFALTHDAAWAEDVVQETFLAAVRGAAGFSGGSVRAWLFIIARNAWHRSHRRRVGEPASFEGLDQLGVAAGWGDPEAHVAAVERADALRSALGRLDPLDREILALRDQDGLTGPEAAEVLQLPLSAVKARLHRARLRLMCELRSEVGHAAGA
jgi:RNA polymerase sigma-70 factor (ECF subfamily)